MSNQPVNSHLLFCFFRCATKSEVAVRLEDIATKMLNFKMVTESAWKSFQKQRHQLKWTDVKRFFSPKKCCCANNLWCILHKYLCIHMDRCLWIFFYFQFEIRLWRKKDSCRPFILLLSSAFSLFYSFFFFFLLPFFPTGCYRSKWKGSERRDPALFFLRLFCVQF